MGHGAVFAKESDQLLIAAGLCNLLREEGVDLAAGESRKDFRSSGHAVWMDLPGGTYILTGFEMSHFALDQSPVDIPYPDKTEQTQVSIGQSDIELFL